jgi:serine/threonine-protein phosphatase 2B catalytic subunit
MLTGLYKYDQEIYAKIMDSFDFLPLGALINNRFLAIHGGISPAFQTVSCFLIVKA